MLRRTFLILLPLALGLGADDFSARANKHVQAWADAGRFSGAVMVAKDGKPLLRAGYGLANREWGIPNGPDTKFRIGSVTKQFTAVAILQLAEQGKLKLDDPVSKYYSEAPAAWEKVTIHHLLTHTSGIPSYTDNREFMRNRTANPLKPLEIAALTKDDALQFLPGEKHRYNNTGYVLLGHVIERASGEAYGDYVKKHIFEPAGMQDSGYDSYAAVIPRRASGYSPEGVHAQFIDMSIPFAAGALYSTVDDMVKWDRALANGALLSRESFERMITPALNDYAYGWSVKPVRGQKAMHHGGGIFGFNTWFVRIPEEGLSLAVFANQNGPVEPLGNELLALYYGETVKPPEVRKQISLKPDVLDRFTGEYEVRPGLLLTVRRGDNALITQATGQSEVPVYPFAENQFFARRFPGELEFTSDAEGKVTGVRVRMGPNPQGDGHLAKKIR